MKKEMIIMKTTNPISNICTTCTKEIEKHEIGYVICRFDGESYWVLIEAEEAPCPHCMLPAVRFIVHSTLKGAEKAAREFDESEISGWCAWPEEYLEAAIPITAELSRALLGRKDAKN